jgi:hypothetical protein
MALQAKFLTPAKKIKKGPQIRAPLRAGPRAAALPALRLIRACPKGNSLQESSPKEHFPQTKQLQRNSPAILVISAILKNEKFQQVNFDSILFSLHKMGSFIKIGSEQQNTGENVK